MQNCLAKERKYDVLVVLQMVISYLLGFLDRLWKSSYFFMLILGNAQAIKIRGKEET